MMQWSHKTNPPVQHTESKHFSFFPVLHKISCVTEQVTEVEHRIRWHSLAGIKSWVSGLELCAT